MANNPSRRIISFSALFLESDMAEYIVPHREPPTSPSTNMEAAFDRLRNSGAGAFGARPTVVESIIVDGEIGGSIYGTIYPTISGSQMVLKLIESLRKDY